MHNRKSQSFVFNNLTLLSCVVGTVHMHIFIHKLVFVCLSFVLLLLCAGNGLYMDKIVISDNNNNNKNNKSQKISLTQAHAHFFSIAVMILLQ